MPILKSNGQMSIASKGMNANILKIVAVVAMFFDHATLAFVPDGTPLNWTIHFFGRLAAPLICYLIAEGFHYTSNKKAYTMRLFIFAVISHFPYVLYYGLSWWKATSVMWSLMLGLFALTIAHHKKLNFYTKGLLILACCMAAYTANWNYIAVLWIVSFGVFRDQFDKKVVAYVAIGFFLYVLPGIQEHGMAVSYRIGFLMAIVFFYLYNRQPGKRNAFIKWGFYWFYPVHLLLLLLLSKLFL